MADGLGTLPSLVATGEAVFKAVDFGTGISTTHSVDDMQLVLRDRQP
jgi:hypothetical protein